MTIFNTIDLNKSINYFPRLDTNPVSILITNEATNISTSFNIDTLGIGSYYSIVYFTLTNGYLVQDDFYFFKILDIDENVIFQDKIFTTNQILNYSINANQYKEHETTNEYIIYG